MPDREGATAKPAIRRITLTGFDERTPIPAIQKLAAEHPAFEAGLLLTMTPEGRPRYPSRDWLAAAAAALSGRCAIHVCGSGARGALLAGEIGDLLAHAPRFQVNGVLDRDVVETIATRYPLHTVITQHHDRNLALLQVAAPNHALLVDGSGGQGLQPHHWEHPGTGKQVGFAGGLGPETLAAALPRIEDVALGPSWIDMEGKLRDANDWFDLDHARAALDAFTTWQAMGPRGLVSPLPASEKAG